MGFHGEITPENIINPPSCTVGKQRDAEATVTSVMDAIGEYVERMKVWRSLTAASRRALEDVHDGVPPRMPAPAAACLTEKGLIQPNGAVTLLGRLVVHEARRSNQLWRRVNCRRRAEHPDQAAQLGLPAGCCTKRLGHTDCGCECHEMRRLSPVSRKRKVS